MSDESIDFEDLEPEESTPLWKSPALSSSEFIGNRRDFLDLCLAVAVGGATFWLGRKANDLSDTATRITQNQSTIMEQQTDLMAQQNQMQLINSLPNFVLRDWHHTAPSVAKSEKFAIENTGGMPRYPYIRMRTFVEYLLSVSEDDVVSHYTVPETFEVGTTDYYTLEEVVYGQGNIPVRWIFTNDSALDRVHGMLIEVSRRLEDELGEEGFRQSFVHRLLVSYMDYQGVDRMENFSPVYRPSHNDGGNQVYSFQLDPISPEHHNFITRMQMNVFHGSPIIGRHIDADSDEWEEAVNTIVSRVLALGS